MKESILIALVIILLYIFIFNNTENIDLEYIENIEGNNVLVRKTQNNYTSAILLSKLINNMYLLRQILINNIDNYPENRKYIEQLKNNFNKNRTTVYENSLDSDTTSYCVNKGEEFVFCLRCKKTKNLHTLNLLTYVAVHEMAHAGCPEIGHTKLFNQIFEFFLKVAEDNNIYVYENYYTNPVHYCGLKLNTNILGSK